MRLRSLLTCAALSGAVFYTPDADACGGCFPPQGENNSVVTDHRMVLSVSTTQSTLYDQIEYSGSPSEFAWILPIAGTVDVGLSAQSLFTGLDTLTSVVVQEPPRNCPQPPPECYSNRGVSDSAGAGSSSSGGTSSGSFPAPADAGVTVIKTEVVGPYETVQLHPTTENDVAALEGWLADHNFNVPADIKPVIAQYVKEHFNFLALRLKPGTTDIKSMRPVRVTTQGANVALPLRMVAAGTGANVGITLWVVSQGRYEPSNFQSFTIKDADITWDWDTGASDFKTVRATKQSANPGKLWEVESSITTFGGQIQNAASFGGGGGSGGSDYLAATDTATGTTKQPYEVQQEDYATLLEGLGGSTSGQDVHITRLRADLSRAALTTDLTVGAAADQTDLARTRQPKLEKSQPICPVYVNCTVVGQLPRDQAVQQSSGGPLGSSGASSGSTSSGSTSDGTFTCRASAPRSSDAPLTVAFGFVAMAIGRTIRERRRRR